MFQGLGRQLLDVVPGSVESGTAYYVVVGLGMVALSGLLFFLLHHRVKSNIYPVTTVYIGIVFLLLAIIGYIGFIAYSVLLSERPTPSVFHRISRSVYTRMVDRFDHFFGL